MGGTCSMPVDYAVANATVKSIVKGSNPDDPFFKLTVLVNNKSIRVERDVVKSYVPGDRITVWMRPNGTIAGVQDKFDGTYKRQDGQLMTGEVNCNADRVTCMASCSLLITMMGAIFSQMWVAALTIGAVLASCTLTFGQRDVYSTINLFIARHITGER